MGAHGAQLPATTLTQRPMLAVIHKIDLEVTVDNAARVRPRADHLVKHATVIAIADRPLRDGTPRTDGARCGHRIAPLMSVVRSGARS